MHQQMERSTDVVAIRAKGVGLITDNPCGLVVDFLVLEAKPREALAPYARVEAPVRLGRPGGGPAATGGGARNRASVLPRLRRPAVPGRRARRAAGLADRGDRPRPATGWRKARYLKAVTGLSEAFALVVLHERAPRIRGDPAFFQAARARIGKLTSGDGRTEGALMPAVRQLVSRAIAPVGLVDLAALRGARTRRLGAQRGVPRRDARPGSATPSSQVAAQAARRLNPPSLTTRCARWRVSW